MCKLAVSIAALSAGKCATHGLEKQNALSNETKLAQLWMLTMIPINADNASCNHALNIAKPKLRQETVFVRSGGARSSVTEWANRHDVSLQEPPTHLTDPRGKSHTGQIRPKCSDFCAHTYEELQVFAQKR